MNVYEKECIRAYKSFKRKRNFSREVPNCVYDIEIELPPPPSDPATIENWGKPKKERKFPVVNWEYVKYIDNLPNSNPEKIEFISKTYERRKNGFWWYNGDNLEWVNGHYYMTLQFWHIPIEDRDGGTDRPRFVDMHRDMNYAIWYGKNDTRCSGLAYVGSRRSSKTVQGVANGYWDTTEKENALFTIQSKTESDGKGVLRKLLLSWKKLPRFLKPTDTGLTTVTTRLSFSEPQKRSTKGERKEYKQVLNSAIESFSSKEYAVDGLRTTFQFHDEFGKTIDSDVYLRQQVARVSCVVGSKVVGFSFWATTVEEMTKGGGENAKKIWNEADPGKRNKNGRTVNTMYRLFFPSEYGMFEGEDNGVAFVDEWGYSNTEAAAAWLEKEAEGMDGDALIDFRRKFPRNIDHAFMVNVSENTYNQHKLYQQHVYNQQLREGDVVRGNFYWRGGEKDTEVDFAPDPVNGRWLVAWMPPEEDRNKYESKLGHRFPTRDFCRTGCDPFSHRETVEKGSEGAASTILMRHYSYPKMNMSFVCHYLYRQTHPHQLAEDMIMQCVFYSSKFLCENNKYGVIDYFEKRGYDGYCMYDPLDEDSVKKWIKGRRGIPMTGIKNREALMDITQAYINDYIGQLEDESFGFCPFDGIIDDWRRFEPSKWTKYDSAVSAGIALIATKKQQKAAEQQFAEQANWFKQWDNKGKFSVDNRRNNDSF